MDEELARLADKAGIEARYWDIQGRLHETSPETMRALLFALGLPASTGAEVAQSVTVLAEEPWASCLPPVIIAWENRPRHAPFRLPLSETTKTIRWSVHLEAGEVLSGERDLAAFTVIEVGQYSGRSMALRHVELPPLSPGYHSFRFEATDVATSQLIVAPERCHLPEDSTRARYWGIAAQLYALRSEANWGIGDFGDLRQLIDLGSSQGADTIGLNPLHALFLDTPEQASPYSPNSRIFRNPLYLDLSAVPDLSECPEARSALDAAAMVETLRDLRKKQFIDYKGVAEAKLRILRLLHRYFEVHHGQRSTKRGQAFVEFLKRSGPALDQFATFQALSESLGTHDWTRWQAPWRDDVRSPDLSLFQNEHADRIAFFKYLQWLCEEQIAAAAEHARRNGMVVGLYNDLAVSVDAASADHWMNQDAFSSSARIGAPPDPFNEAGQEWGLVPLNPRKLASTGYAYFISVLQANMRHAGALRIDHAMGLQRLFLIPAGAPVASGAYVRYPFDELLALAALESQRNRCMIVGEDLGTVPAGFRERMQAANVLSSRVFYFERRNGEFLPPSDYPALAAVSASTHDLATLHGFWTGADIAAKSDLGILASSDEIARAHALRKIDKTLLITTLLNEGLLRGSEWPSDIDRMESPAIIRAIHLYLSRTPSLMLLVQLDDLADEEHQANMPGSTAGHPSWRRRLSRTAGELSADAQSLEQMAAINMVRATMD